MILSDGADEAARQEALALNNAAVPAVNALERAEFDRLCALGTLRLVEDGAVLGALLTLPNGIHYDSANYAWFSARFDDFVYVDRIAVAPAARGRGIGRLLYEDLIARTKAAGGPRICAEVNTRPPNPGSLTFHERLGFTPLLERENQQSGKRVLMLTLDLAGASSAAA